MYVSRCVAHRIRVVGALALTTSRSPPYVSSRRSIPQATSIHLLVPLTATFRDKSMAPNHTHL
eukprot:scaffold166794_cov32-Tisochrysis_lutea.AAC.4